MGLRKNLYRNILRVCRIKPALYLINFRGYPKNTEFEKSAVFWRKNSVVEIIRAS